MNSALRVSLRLFKFDPIEFSPLRYIQATCFAFTVAWMERSAIRGFFICEANFPDYALLRPGYI